jgi:hypothetical protein
MVLYAKVTGHAFGPGFWVECEEKSGKVWQDVVGQWLQLHCERQGGWCTATKVLS